MQVKDLCIVCANNYKTSDKWHDFYYLDTGNLTQNRISELQHFQTELNSFAILFAQCCMVPVFQRTFEDNYMIILHSCHRSNITRPIYIEKKNKP